MCFQYPDVKWKKWLLQCGLYGCKCWWLLGGRGLYKPTPENELFLCPSSECRLFVLPLTIGILSVLQGVFRTHHWWSTRLQSGLPKYGGSKDCCSLASSPGPFEKSGLGTRLVVRVPSFLLMTSLVPKPSSVLGGCVRLTDGYIWRMTVICFYYQ